MYKIKFDGASGVGLYFVTEAKTSLEAKNKFYSEMASTDKIKETPKKTNKRFIEGVKKRSGGFWVVKP